MPVLSARNISKAYGAERLFSGISLTITRKEHVGLLGINGTGKSTLLRILAGIEKPDDVLVAQPSLAILDEPTNHLDADTITWLEEYLASEYEGAVLLVTHDRYVLDAVCDRTLEIDRGALFEYQGGYGDYLEQKAERLSH